MSTLFRSTMAMTLAASLAAGPTILAAGFSSVAAPILEEILYRGIVYRGPRRDWGVGGATLLSGLLFAFSHQWVLDARSVVTYSLTSIALALLYERTRSLLAPIALHAFVNALRDVFGFGLVAGTAIAAAA